MKSDQKIRYAVVGAGWIGQAAFMPGVKPTCNSVLAAIERALTTGPVQELTYRSKRPLLDQRSDFAPASKLTLIHAAPPEG